jgi:deoxyribodipyrimidine photolyase-related protein
MPGSQANLCRTADEQRRNVFVALRNIMEEVTIIYPHQLFRRHPALHTTRTVYLVEAFLFFRQYRFHQQKIWLHRATMKQYAELLDEKGYRVVYSESTEELSDTGKLLPHLASEGARTIHYADSTDNWLERRINKQAAFAGIELRQYKTPNFLNSKEELDHYTDNKKAYFQTDFYISQCKKKYFIGK